MPDAATQCSLVSCYAAVLQRLGRWCSVRASSERRVLQPMEFAGFASPPLLRRVAGATMEHHRAARRVTELQWGTTDAAMEHSSDRRNIAGAAMERHQ